MPVVRSARVRRTSTTPSSHGGPQRGFVAASHAMGPGSGGIHEKVNVAAAAASKTSRRKCSNAVTTTSQIRGEVSGLQKSKKRPTWTFEAANSQWAKNSLKKSKSLLKMLTSSGLKKKIPHSCNFVILWAHSFTSFLMADLCQDINRISSFSKCSVKSLVH